MLLACGSQSSNEETSGRSQNLDGLSYQHQMHRLAVVMLFVCQEFSEKDMSISRDHPG